MMVIKCYDKNLEILKEGVLFEVFLWNEIGFILFGINYIFSK